MVDVQGKGPTNIMNVQVNDYVRSGTHSYSKVYSFGQKNHHLPSRMTVIETSSPTSPVLKLTFDHMVYLEGSSLPVTAGSIQVGDQLATVNNGEEEAVRGVVKITHNVAETGFVTPITTSGTLVVDGIVASVYAGKHGHSHYLPNAGGAIGGRSATFLHYHTISHVATAPLRFTCTWISSSFCGTRFHHADEESNEATSGQHVFFTALHSAKHFVRSPACGPVGHAVLFTAILGAGLFFEYILVPLSLLLVLAIVWYQRTTQTKTRQRYASSSPSTTKIKMA